MIQPRFMISMDADNIYHEQVVFVRMPRLIAWLLLKWWLRNTPQSTGDQT